MLMRRCICGRMVQQGKKCPDCEKKYQKQYDRTKRNKERAAFYHSAAWKRISEAVKARASGLDEYELAHGNVVKGTTVHHIEPLADNPELGLDMHNLIYVSDLTHQKVHAEYAKGSEARARMQEKLRETVPPYGKYFV